MHPRSRCETVGLTWSGTVRLVGGVGARAGFFSLPRERRINESVKVKSTRLKRIQLNLRLSEGIKDPSMFQELRLHLAALVPIVSVSFGLPVVLHLFRFAHAETTKRRKLLSSDSGRGNIFQPCGRSARPGNRFNNYPQPPSGGGSKFHQSYLHTTFTLWNVLLSVQIL